MDSDTINSLATEYSELVEAQQALAAVGSKTSETMALRAQAEFDQSIEALGEDVGQEIYELVQGHEQRLVQLKSTKATLEAEGITAGLKELDKRIAAEEKRAEEDHVLGFALYFVNRHSESFADLSGVEVLPVPEPRPSPKAETEVPAPATEATETGAEKVKKSPVEFSVEINEEGQSYLIARGSRKKEYSLFKRPETSQQDSSALRLATTKVIFEADRPLSTLEVWNSSMELLGYSPDAIPEFDEDAMRRVRNFYKDTFIWRRQRIIITDQVWHGADYQVNPDNICLPVPARGKDEIISIDDIQKMQLIVARRRVAKGLEVSGPASLLEQLELEKIGSEIPGLPSVEEIARFISFIGGIDDVIANGYIKLASQETQNLTAFFVSVKKFSDASSEILEGKSSQLSDQERIEARINTMNELYELIDDDEKVQEVLERIEELDAKYKLPVSSMILEMLGSIQGMSGFERKMLKDLIKAKTVEVVNAEVSRRGSHIQDIEREIEIGGEKFTIIGGNTLSPVISEWGSWSTISMPEEDPDLTPPADANEALRQMTERGEEPEPNQATEPVSNETTEPVVEGTSRPLEVPPQVALPTRESSDNGADGDGAKKSRKRSHRGRKGRAASSEKDSNAWESRLRHDIGEILNVLEQDGAIQDEILTARDFGFRSSSAKAGTATSIERLQEKGLMGRGSGKQKLIDTPLTRAQRVLTLLANSHQVFDKKNPRQKRAVAIVDECIDSFLESRSEQN